MTNSHKPSVKEGEGEGEGEREREGGRGRGREGGRGRGREGKRERGGREEDLTNKISPTPRILNSLFWSSTPLDPPLSLYRNKATPITISNTMKYLATG